MTLTDARGVRRGANDNTGVEALSGGILDGLAAQCHVARETFKGDGLEAAGQLVEVGQGGEEISHFRIEAEK